MEKQSCHHKSQKRPLEELDAIGGKVIFRFTMRDLERGLAFKTRVLELETKCLKNIKRALHFKGLRRFWRLCHTWDHQGFLRGFTQIAVLNYDQHGLWAWYIHRTITSACTFHHTLPQTPIINCSHSRCGPGQLGWTNNRTRS